MPRICTGTNLEIVDGVVQWLPTAGIATCSAWVPTQPDILNVVPFDTVTAEGGLTWDADRYAFVIPFAGIWAMTLNVTFQENGAQADWWSAAAVPVGRRLARIIRNTTIIASKQRDAVGIDDLSVGVCRYLEEGDTVSAVVFQNMGAPLALKSPVAPASIPPYGQPGSTPWVVPANTPALAICSMGEGEVA